MQSTAARVTVAVVSVAVLAILFIVLSGGDDDGGDTTQAEVTTTTTGAEAEDKPDKEPKPEKPEVPEIEIVGGEPKGGPADLEFAKGEEVRFDVTSDVDEEVHIHGYDIYVDLVAGETAKVDFPAEIDGIFEVELHGTGALIAELRVDP